MYMTAILLPVCSRIQYPDMACLVSLIRSRLEWCSCAGRDASKPVEYSVRHVSEDKMLVSLYLYSQP